jgi:hypothetical protein
MTHACAYQRDVERLRRHREEMQVAIAEGLSLEGARERLDSFRAHAARLDADRAPVPVAPAASPRPLLPQWWQRD